MLESCVPQDKKLSIQELVSGNELAIENMDFIIKFYFRPFALFLLYNEMNMNLWVKLRYANAQLCIHQ